MTDEASQIEPEELCWRAQRLLGPTAVKYAASRYDRIRKTRGRDSGPLWFRVLQQAGWPEDDLVLLMIDCSQGDKRNKLPPVAMQRGFRVFLAVKERAAGYKDGTRWLEAFKAVTGMQEPQVETFADAVRVRLRAEMDAPARRPLPKWKH